MLLCVESFLNGIRGVYIPVIVVSTLAEDGHALPGDPLQTGGGGQVEAEGQLQAARLVVHQLLVLALLHHAVHARPVDEHTHSLIRNTMRSSHTTKFHTDFLDNTKYFEDIRRKIFIF